MMMISLMLMVLLLLIMMTVDDDGDFVDVLDDGGIVFVVHVAHGRLIVMIMMMKLRGLGKRSPFRERAPVVR